VRVLSRAERLERQQSSLEKKRNASKALPVAKDPATPSTVLQSPTRARLLATLPPKNMMQKRWSSTSSRRFSDISPAPLSQTIFKGNVVEQGGNRSTPFLTRVELTTKWEVRGEADTAREYSKGEKAFLHETLPLEDTPRSVEPEESIKWEEVLEAKIVEEDSDAEVEVHPIEEERSL